MKMTEPYNLGLLALISAAGEISYEELKQRYLPPEQPGVIQGVTASFDNDQHRVNAHDNHNQERLETQCQQRLQVVLPDRKSTRLNSSH